MGVVGDMADEVECRERQCKVIEFGRGNSGGNQVMAIWGGGV